jgi:large repetitive protein
MRKPKPNQRSWRSTPIRLLFSLVGFAVSFGGVSEAASPPPGTPIDNFALAAGIDSASGIGISLHSDTVRTVVQGVVTLSLTPGRASFATAGNAVTLPHVLRNTGNLTTDVRLDLGNLAGDGYDLASLSLVRDTNGNGVLDPGDVAISPGSVVTLAAQDSIALLESATVPAGTPNGAVAWSQLTATSLGPPALAIATDSVQAIAAIPPPALAFFSDGSYATTTIVGPIGQPLFVEALAPACNSDPAAIDSVSITLRSLRTGDTQTFIARETAPNSGLFRILPDVPTSQGTPGGGPQPAGVLATDLDDAITATLIGCGAARTDAHLWIDPAGVVFDSRSDAVIPGARVSLIDVLGNGNGGQPGGPAQVFQSDGVTPAPSTVVSDANGRYVFPRVKPSTYRLDVVPPSNYLFPSRTAAARLSPSRFIDPSGSFGAGFAFLLAAAPVYFDVPLDGIPQSALFIEKNVNTSVAEIGDLLDYSVQIESRSDTALTAVVLADQLPTGFAFVKGSARLDSVRLADPVGASGPDLRFAIGDLALNQSVMLHYRVRIGPGAVDGDGVNRAIAHAGGVTSNTSSARVAVSGGVFANEASVLGSVYIRGNAAADSGGTHAARGADLPVPGVRVILDDGTFAITDGAGRFSFYGLTPRTHALRVDRATLPAGARFVKLDHRDGGHGTRFVDLTNGDLQRADFALAPDTSVASAAGQRVANVALLSNEIARTVRTDASWGANANVAGDPRGRPASGIVTGESRLPLFGNDDRTPAAAGGAPAPDSSAAQARIALATTPDAVSAAADPVFERLLKRQTSDVGFIGLADGDTVTANRVSVRVKGEPDVPFQLWVNGDPVSPNRVGRKVQLGDGDLEAWDYVGVELHAGSNRLEVAQRGACGDEHGRAAISLIAPDDLGRIGVDVSGSATADGHSAVNVRVRALDAHGVAVANRTYVTLESTLGHWQGDDLDPASPGVQEAVEGGTASFRLTAPSQPGVAVVRVTSGAVSAETTVTFVPDLSGMIAVGTAEGVVALRSRSRNPNAPDANPSFEALNTQFLSERQDGTASASAHGALYLKGPVRPGTLLTLGYDSDRPDGQRQFRDIQPDAFYPVYGDASVRGFDAQTAGSLYARLDRRDGTLMYGDFVAQTTGGAHSLATFSRTMTGLAEHFEDARVRVDAFTSRDRSHERLDELTGLGVSGPYQLTAAPILENSERVEILTRDRDQPSVVLRTESRARFTDYEIDPLTGRIVFKAPVPSYDADLNPVSVRVQYQVGDGGDPFWVSGAEARMKLNSRLEVGGTYVDDQHPDASNELRGVFAGARLGPATTLEGEYATTHHYGGELGQGGRIEFSHQDPRVQARAYIAVTDSAYSNPEAGFGSGRTEASLRVADRIDERTQLRAEGLYTSDVGGTERRGGLLGVVDRTLSDVLRGEFGVRIADDHRVAGGAPPPEFALRGKMSAQWPGHPEFSGFAELEQNLTDARRMAALGGEYRFSPHGRLYLRHELISSLQGPTALDASERRLSTVFGIDTDLSGSTHVFSEYRLADALAGRDAEAAVGLRNGWQINPDLRLHTTFERVNPLMGSTAGPTTAATGAFEYTADENWKATSRLELRSNRSSDGFLASLAMAGRVNATWTALGRTLMDFENMRAQGQNLRDRVQVGFAYRAPGSSWDALGRYELHYDRTPAASFDADRRLAHVLSLHASGPAGRGLQTSFSWAGKIVQQGDETLTSTNVAQWLHGRVTRDFGDAWDAGLTASTLMGEHGSHRDGLGFELGRSVRDGVWLSAGWNYFGYQDPDLPTEEYTQRGPFIRLRARFDEDLFKPSSGGAR